MQVDELLTPKRLILLSLLFPLVAFASEDTIYRCDTPGGTVFSDRPCSEEAEVVEIEDSSAGIAYGPPEEVRDYLDEKRDERADDREKRIAARAAAPKPQPPQVITIERPGYYPGYWQRPPLYRPPRPVQPIAPTPSPPPRNSVIRPSR